ncbi:MAG TPA: POTRA domain-containing protein, partial [Candidatus Bathyarchaeia archaeon]|nr:POTRA domain-containing protein [Candidatus Bathyarchaeia archaeon]
MSSSTGASKRRGAAGAILAWSLAAAIAAAAGAVSAAAQEAPVPAVPSVGRIVILVDGQPGDPGLLDLVPFRTGDAYSPRLVDQAVKQIFKTGLFADVQVTKSGEQPVDLTFALVRKIFINAVRFKGPRVSSTRLIQGLTVLRPGGFLQEERVPDAVREVQAGLRQAGFFNAVVVCDVRPKGPAIADLVFRALDWKTFQIGGLEVEWKSEIPERTLLKKMKTRIGQVYVPSRLEADRQALTKGLDAAGYPRAEVRLAGESFDEENRRVDLRLEIVPNEKIVVAVNGAKVPLRLLTPIWE